MIKIIHVLSDTNIGGAGILLINVLKNIDKSNFLIKVILPKASLLKERIVQLGYEVIEVDGIKDKSMDFKAIKTLTKIFKSEKPHIVHTHSSMSGKIAALLSGIKSRIYTKHCAFKPSKKITTFPGKQICGFINNILSTKIIAVAHVVKQILLDTGVKENKIVVIINGSEPLKRVNEEEIYKLRTQYSIEQEDFVFGIVARLVDVKGQEYFIKAAKEMMKKYSDIKFIIAGTGECEEKYKLLANNNNNIIFTGFVSNISKVFSIIDVNVNCSYVTEATSLSLAEGMSLGKPIIASMHGGNTYMVEDGINGFLCQKQNVVELVSKMEEIYLNKELYEKMSENAVNTYKQKFTAKKMTEELEKVYLEEYQRIIK